MLLGPQPGGRSLRPTYGYPLAHFMQRTLRRPDPPRQIPVGSGPGRTRRVVRANVVFGG